MKILFFAKGHESLAIEALSAMLKQAGHEVSLLFDPGLDSVLGFLDLAWLRQKNDQRHIRFIDAFQPDLICFSALTNLYSFVAEKAALIKKHFSIPIVVGGMHPTLVPEFVLANPHIDMICLGEGDEALLELACAMEQGKDYYTLQNFWFKKDGAVIKNPLRPLIQDLDRLPFPDRDLFHQYGTFAGTLYITTGRGCPFTCTYCCHHTLQKMYRHKGCYVRRRSVENVIRELEQCVTRYTVKSVYSMDDTFTLDEAWIETFADEYRKRIKRPLYCHVRPGTITRNMLDSLCKAGCTDVFYGIDSGNEEVRFKLMNRKITNETMLQDTQLLKDYGISVTTSAIFGFPHETPRQMMETVELIKTIKSDFAYTYMFYPFPETDSFNYCREHGLIDEETVDKILTGHGSFHQKSLLKSDSADFALLLKNMLPFSVTFPRLQWLADMLIQNRWYTLSRLIFILSAPITYAQYGRNKIRELVSMALANMRMRLPG